MFSKPSFASRQLPVLILVCASTLWGLSWLPLKYLNGLGFEGIFLLLVSQGILAFLITPWGFRLSAIRQNKRPLILIAFTGGAAILCFTYALIYGDVIRVMVLFYLLPIWGVLGGKIFLGENPDRVRWLGVLLALSGAFLVLGGVKIFAAPPSWIDLLALASGICFAANNVVFRGVPQVALATKLMFMFYGCTVLSILCLVAGFGKLPSGAALADWGMLLLYTLTWLLCANVGSQWAVTKMEAGRSSIILIMELVAAVISAMIILDERLNAIEWMGCVFIVVAALLEAVREPNKTMEIEK